MSSLFFHFFETILTPTIKVSDVALNRTREVGGCKRIDILYRFHGDVVYRTAIRAEKMIMVPGISIEMISSIPTGDLLNLSKLHKEVQIAVDGAQADVWELLADAHVYSIGCGVVRSSHKEFLDGFPLPAIF